MSLCKVTFEPAGVTAEVDTEKPSEGLGEPGTLLNIAIENGIDIDHSCDGAGVCGMCFVEIVEGAENLSPPSPEEDDLLAASAPDMENARLACLAVVRGDVVCRTPK